MADALGHVGLGAAWSVVRAAGARPLHGGCGDSILRDDTAVLDVPFIVSDASPQWQRLQPLHDPAGVVVLAVHVPGAQRARAGAASIRLAAAVAAYKALQPAQLVTRARDAAAAGTRMTLTFCECRLRTCSSLGLVRVQMASVSV